MIQPSIDRTIDLYTTCWTIEHWDLILAEAMKARFVGFDFETKPNGRTIDLAPKKIGKKVNKAYPSALRPEFGAKIAGIAIAWLDEDLGKVKSAYIGIRHDQRFAGGIQPSSKEVIQSFSEWMKERPKDKLVVVHNLSMELGFMLAENIVWPLEGQLHDIQIAARVLNKGVGWNELIGLKPLQKDVLGRDLDTKNDMDRWLKDHKFKPGADIWRAPVPLAGLYAQDDAADTLLIFLKWYKWIYQAPTRWWWYRGPDRRYRLDLYELEIESAIQATIAGMRGTRYDRNLAERQTVAATTLQAVATRWVRSYLKMPTLNPGSNQQLRGILFRNKDFGFKPSMMHTTDAFKKMRERDQVKIMAGYGDKSIIDYMSLDVDALQHYGEQHPEHEDLMFMLQVYRKCNTALAWFNERAETFGAKACPDPWFNYPVVDDWVDLMFHRLRTVGTVSGRMSSADYNAQQVPKRFKMLVNADLLFRILEAFLSPREYEYTKNVMVMSKCKEGDEAKVLKLEPGSPVVDFSVRSLFISRPGHMMRLLDLSQVELRGFAHYTGATLFCDGYGTPMQDDQVSDELKYIRDYMETGELPDKSKYDVDWRRHLSMEENPFDAHQGVADEIGMDRKSAKGINFGILYGMGQKKLARGQGWTKAQSYQYMREYHGRLPEIKQVQDNIKKALRQRGFVFDPFGRRYYLPISKAYVGLNRLIQGWAASAFKVGFVRTCQMFASKAFNATEIHPIIRRRIPTDARVLTCIHDELMNEIKEELDTPHTDWCIRSCMTAFFGLKVPLASSSERGPKSWDGVSDVKAVDIAA
jgi:DNA polymerase I-like protein with 3'-5' exonuclease and polymerase domains